MLVGTGNNRAPKEVYCSCPRADGEKSAGWKASGGGQALPHTTQRGAERSGPKLHIAFSLCNTSRSGERSQLRQFRVPGSLEPRGPSRAQEGERKLIPISCERFRGFCRQ